MSEASEVELLMLALINEERTSRGLDRLTINNALNETAEDHSQWMLDNDIFNHTGVGGSNHFDRIAAGDYELEGAFRTAENIGWQSERGSEGIADDVRNIHASLMASPGHRDNILNPDFEDIGIGIERSDFRGFDGIMITQNFGRTDAISDTPEQESAPVVVSEIVAPVVVAPVVTEEMTPVVEEAMPVEVVETAEDTGPTVPTDSTSSGGTVTASSGPDGPNVVVNGEGNFTATVTATDGEDTVTETVSLGAPIDAPGESVEVADTGDDTGDGPTVTTGTTSSGATVTATSGGADGPSVVVGGDGNFTATGTATDDEETVTETASGGSPIDIPEELVEVIDNVSDASDGPTVTTGTTFSRGTVTATSGPDGQTVVVGGEGNFIARGTATNGEDTTTETASGGSLANAALDEDGTEQTLPGFDFDSMFAEVFERFNFARMSMREDFMGESTVVEAFEGTISTADGTFTTNDRAEFDAMLPDMFEMSCMFEPNFSDFG